MHLALRALPCACTLQDVVVKLYSWPGRFHFNDPESDHCAYFLDLTFSRELTRSNILDILPMMNRSRMSWNNLLCRFLYNSTLAFNRIVGLFITGIATGTRVASPKPEDRHKRSQKFRKMIQTDRRSLENMQMYLYHCCCDTLAQIPKICSPKTTRERRRWSRMIKRLPKTQST